MRPRTVRLKPCGIYFCRSLIPPWRRACWHHQPALEAVALAVAAAVSVVVLTSIN